MKANAKAADIARARSLLADILRDANCLAVQMELMDDELRSLQDVDRLAIVAASIHRAADLVAPALEQSCDELATLMGGLDYPPGSRRVADTLNIEAADLRAGVGVMGAVLRDPDDLKFRESIDYCQVSLTALLSQFLTLRATTCKALATADRAARQTNRPVASNVSVELLK